VRRHDDVRLTVLMANHNYARYLATAIDSVLVQDHPGLELVVVDDGSTDDSASILRSYGDRVITVFKARGGQASAMNAGFERSTGDIVCMLDADDTFLPGKARRVAEAFARTPADHALLHHRLQIVDSAGRPMGAAWPRAVPTGDLRSRAARSAGWYPRPVMSGLCFRRSYLERLFPVPTEPCRAEGPLGPVTVELKPDTYLAAPAALVGPVIGLAEVLGTYRVHGRNKSGAGGDEAELPALLNRRVGQFAVEFDALVASLRDAFGLELPLRLDDHHERQLHLRALGAASTVSTLRHVVSSPVLPPALKAREAAKLLAGRGWGRRVPGQPRSRA
jgi:hypothetical protein